MLWRRPDAWNAGGAAFSTWLYRVVVNRCIDQARRRRLRSWMPFGEAPDPVDDAPDAVSALAGREHLAEVRFMIRALPEKQRVALLLAVQGERSNADIGSILGISEGAAEQTSRAGEADTSRKDQGEGGCAMTRDELNDALLRFGGKLER